MIALTDRKRGGGLGVVEGQRMEQTSAGRSRDQECSDKPTMCGCHPIIPSNYVSRVHWDATSLMKRTHVWAAERNDVAGGAVVVCDIGDQTSAVTTDQLNSEASLHRQLMVILYHGIAGKGGRDRDSAKSRGGWQITYLICSRSRRVRSSGAVFACGRLKRAEVFGASGELQSIGRAYASAERQ
jgi:hypothetical protein